jgi:hypothetical protein
MSEALLSVGAFDLTVFWCCSSAERAAAQAGQMMPAPYAMHGGVGVEAIKPSGKNRATGW